MFKGSFFPRKKERCKKRRSFRLSRKKVSFCVFGCKWREKGIKNQKEKEKALSFPRKRNAHIFKEYFHSSALRKIWQITVGVFLACAAAFLMLPLSFIKVATAVALGLNPPPPLGEIWAGHLGEQRALISEIALTFASLESGFRKSGVSGRVL